MRSYRARPHRPVGSVSPLCAPGWSRLTRISPSVSDTSDAPMNQPSVRAPIRPSALVSPICAMPVTSVANTSGAMIILISRRNRSLGMVR